MKSVPNGCMPPGGARENFDSVVVGSNCVISGAKIAISTNMLTITAPAAPSG
jgi:hypothetical protein